MKHEEMLYKLAYIEEQSACQRVNNDKERIEKRIRYLENHLKALKEILEKEDFR